MSDTDDSFNFLISMCYTQLFNLLCEKADDVYGGRLPVHVRCLIDECAIFIVIYGRMIEIYLVTSVAPVPMAAMMGKEWGGMGQNYLRSLLALGFQAFLIIVCVAIYAVLVQNIALEDDIIMAIWSCVGYTVSLYHSPHRNYSRTAKRRCTTASTPCPTTSSWWTESC